jgi:hypothetical protein
LLHHPVHLHIPGVDFVVDFSLVDILIMVVSMITAIIRDIDLVDTDIILVAALE